MADIGGESYQVGSALKMVQAMKVHETAGSTVILS